MKALKKLEATALLSFAGCVTALAQDITLDKALEKTYETVKNGTTVNLVCNIISVVILVAAVIYTAYSYITRGQNDQQGNSKLLSTIVYALIAIGVVQLFKAIIGS